MDTTENKLLWSIKETCEQLNLSRSTVLTLAYNGSLPSVMIGRRRMFLPDKVSAWAGTTEETLPVADVVEDSPTEMDLLEKRVSALERKTKNLAATSKETEERVTGVMKWATKTFSSLTGEAMSVADELRPLVGFSHRQLGELEDTVKQLRASTTSSLHTAQVEIYEQIALLTVLYDRLAPLLEAKKRRWYSFGRSNKEVE
jgi:excisionase family DNA binding protein